MSMLAIHSASPAGASAGLARPAPAQAPNQAPAATSPPAPGAAITAPATKPDFRTAAPDRAAAAEARTWRLSEVAAALGAGPQAERLLAAAERPGPVAPGSLMETLKLLRSAAPFSGSR